jgi:hypothetical protein
MPPRLLISLSLTLIAAALVLADPAAALTPHPCAALTPCTAVDGPWVTTASGEGQIYTVDCPPGMVALGSDAVFSGALYPVGVDTGGGTIPGVVSQMSFALLSIPPGVHATFMPAVGCVTPGTVTVGFRRQAGTAPGAYRTRVRTVRIRPGVHLRVRHGCARGERLVHSGAGVGFFTRRPPSSRIVKALHHRHDRTGSTTRTLATGPPGVGDNERVELQVTAICAGS